MTHQVTIEGSSMPSVELAAGERRTVTVTDRVRKLVQIGAVIVVAGSLDDPDAPAYGNAEPAESDRDAPEPEGGQPEPDAEPAEPATVYGVGIDRAPAPTKAAGRRTKATGQPASGDS